MSATKHKHIGRCTAEQNLRVFTRAEAEQALTNLGFKFRSESAEWVRGETRGRLSWIPDYCNPDNTTVGTEWFLRQPSTTPGHVGGEITVLHATTEG